MNPPLLGGILRRPRQIGLLVTVCAAIVVGVAALAAPANAHAVLESSAPGDGAVLARPPTRISLHFSEPVGLLPGSVIVVDARKRRVDSSEATHGRTPADVEAKVNEHLPEGSYVVSWRVVSADTHPVHGAFVFSVGTGAMVAPSVSAASASALGAHNWQTATRVLRWFTYAGAFLAAGLAVYRTWPAAEGYGTAEASSSRFRRFAAWGATMAAASSLLSLVTESAADTGLGASAFLHKGVLRQVLGHGVAWTVAGTIVSGLLACMALQGPRRRILRTLPRRLLGSLSIVSIAAALVASGHTRTTSPVVVVFTAGLIHTGAAAIWFGGLAGLLIDATAHAAAPATNRSGADDLLTTNDALKRFSRLATWALLGVAGAGLVLAWSEVRSLAALTSTTYGWLVVAKAGTLAAVAAVAAYNHFRLVPNTDARSPARPTWRRLAAMVGVEVLGLAAVLGFTTVLVDSVPARTAIANQSVHMAAAFGSGTVRVVVEPARVGFNTIDLSFTRVDGSPLDNLSNVQLDLMPPASHLGPIIRRPMHHTAGQWMVADRALSMPGTWRISIKGQPDRFTEWQASVYVRIKP